MKRAVARRIPAVVAAVALATSAGAALAMSPASAAAGAATGYASQNGGTTGGQGGVTVRVTSGTQVHQALCGRAAKDTPITIEVEGTINHGNTSKVSGNSCETAAGVIELKRIANVTIIGAGGGAVFDQLGIHIRESRNIIIRNVTIRNVKKSGSPTSNGGDAIGMESNVRNVWVDQVDLLASGGESEGYDGLFDMKDDTQYVTLSCSTLRNSGRGGLVGSSESDRSNCFEDSHDALGTFCTGEAGCWQVNGNTFDNVTWSSPDEESNPAGPDPRSTTAVSTPCGHALDRTACAPGIVSRTAGANTGMKEPDGRC